MKKVLGLILIAILAGFGCVDTSFEALETKVTETGLQENIEWIKPKEIEKLGFFPKYDGKEDFMLDGQFYFEDDTKYYEVGKILKGDYKDARILLVTSTPRGPYHFPGFWRFIQKGNQLIWLDRYSNEQLFEIQLPFAKTIKKASSELNTFLEKDLSAPKEITVNSSGREAKLVLDEQTPLFFSEENLRQIGVDTTLEWIEEPYSYLNGRLFVEKNQKNIWGESRNPEIFQRVFQSNGFFLRLPDSTTALYSLEIPLSSQDFGLKDVTWKNGQENLSGFYWKEGQSCGYRRGTFANVVFDRVVMESYAKEDAIAAGFPETASTLIEVPFKNEDLEIIAHTKNNEPLYGFKDKNHPVLKSFYEKHYSIETRNLYEKTPVSYDEYIQSTPFFFWNDPFGRKILFINSNFYLPMACGAKPVIYLYPEKEMEVAVQIETSRKLFSSYPEYGDGWKVFADEKGNIFDPGSKTRVPYLFWEDLLRFDSPEKGFVVKRENLDVFLEEKLSYMGLNAKEIADFQEFWIPKMQEKPFYFVTFLQTDEMNEVAPLDVNPKPENVIRVFMDFERLDQEIQVEPLMLRKGDRSGFTVVEWGGKLR